MLISLFCAAQNAQKFLAMQIISLSSQEATLAESTGVGGGAPGTNGVMEP